MSTTHAPKGFTGTVDEVAWAKLMGMAAQRFRVKSSADWAVSVSGSVNRTVNVSAGEAYACGVYDATSASDSVAFGTNGGGSARFDALVATFTWGSDTVVFQAIAGTTSPPSVNTTTSVDNTKINRIPGVRYDALLAVVQIDPSAGILTSGKLFDTRPYGGMSGPIIVTNSTYLTSMDAYPGTEIYAGDTTQRWLTLNGTTWTWPPEAQGELARVDYTSSALLANADTGLPSLNVTAPFIPSGRRIKLSFRGAIACDTAPTQYTFTLWRGAVTTGTALRQIPTQLAMGSGAAQEFSSDVTFNTVSNLTSQLFTVSGQRPAGSGAVTLYGTGSLGPVQYVVEDDGAV